MKRGIIFLTFGILIIMLSVNLFAIRINEVELNPRGNDQGREWIEFYSNDPVFLGDYRLENHDQKEIQVNTTFDGYFVFTINKQWLDNDYEKIYLTKDGETIDKTPTLSDDKNDDNIWYLCGKDWLYGNSTQGRKNNCTSKEKIIIPSSSLNNSTQNNYSNSSSNNISSGKINTISLNPQSIKSDENSQNLDKKKMYAFYGFVAFCILLLILFFIKFAKRNDGII